MREVMVTAKMILLRLLRARAAMGDPAHRSCPRSSFLPPAPPVKLTHTPRWQFILPASGFTALEIQASAPEAREAKKIEGAKTLGELPSRDPARLALYRKMMDDISAVDTGEAVALNMGYAMLTEMLGAAGKPLPDDQVMALLRKQTEGLRRDIDSDAMESAAYIYRDMSMADLKLYEAFLASPAGGRYYDQMQVALGAVMTDEARSFGHRFFVALGYRKA